LQIEKSLKNSQDHRGVGGGGAAKETPGRKKGWRRGTAMLILSKPGPFKRMGETLSGREVKSFSIEK